MFCGTHNMSYTIPIYFLTSGNMLWNIVSPTKHCDGYEVWNHVGNFYDAQMTNPSVQRPIIFLFAHVNLLLFPNFKESEDDHDNQIRVMKPHMDDITSISSKYEQIQLMLAMSSKCYHLVIFDDFIHNNNNNVSISKFATWFYFYI